MSQTRPNEIDLQIQPRETKIDGHTIFRFLPYAKKRHVGPFVFLDYMPASTENTAGLSVRPHPHIGLSTLSYLFGGQALHRDSLGNEIILKPGDVNWMTAGHGIVHSERTPENLAANERHQNLLQFWVALPIDKEDMAPEFFHHPKSEIPSFSHDGVHVDLIAGEAFGRVSPVRIYSKLVFMSLRAEQAATFSFDSEDQTIALLVIAGSVWAGGQNFTQHNLVVFKTGARLELRAEAGARWVLFGGRDFPEERFIHWNFVSSSREKIDAAKARWRDQKFPTVPNETEFIPLPEN